MTKLQWWEGGSKSPPSLYSMVQELYISHHFVCARKERDQPISHYNFGSWWFIPLLQPPYMNVRSPHVIRYRLETLPRAPEMVLSDITLSDRHAVHRVIFGTPTICHVCYSFQYGTATKRDRFQLLSLWPIVCQAPLSPLGDYVPKRMHYSATILP